MADRRARCRTGRGAGEPHGGGRRPARELGRGWSPEQQVSSRPASVFDAGVRVPETTRGDGGAAWVVVVPGTQQWSAGPGPNPFDVTTNVRAMTGDATVAAAGVAVALAAAGSVGRSTADDPVALVGHSQGGILAAALASDTSFTTRHRITHVLTSGAPVALRRARRRPGAVGGAHRRPGARGRPDTQPVGSPPGSPCEWPTVPPPST